MKVLSLSDDNEMSCAEVFALLDEYVDGAVVDAADAELLLPLIEKHLELCKDCHECYDMLHVMVGAEGDLAYGVHAHDADAPPMPTTRVIWNGVVLAESDHTVLVEGNHYFPPDCINRAFFRESDLHTTCPWKGLASYYDIVAGGNRVSNAAWYYPEPKSAADNIKGHVAFYRNMVTIEQLAAPGH